MPLLLRCRPFGADPTNSSDPVRARTELDPSFIGLLLGVAFVVFAIMSNVAVIYIYKAPLSAPSHATGALVWQLLATACMAVLVWRWASIAYRNSLSTDHHMDFFTDPRVGWCPSQEGLAALHECCEAELDSWEPSTSGSLVMIDWAAGSSLYIVFVAAGCQLLSFLLQIAVTAKVIIGYGDRGQILDQEYGAGASRPLLDMTF